MISGESDLSACTDYTTLSSDISVQNDAALLADMKVFNLTFNGTLSITAFIGYLTNLFVILAVTLSRSFHWKARWMLVIHQVFADFVSSLGICLTHLLLEIADGYQHGVHGHLYCSVIWSEALNYFGFYASLMNVVFLTGERFIMILRPNDYNDIVTFHKAKCAIAAVWVIALIFGSAVGAMVRLEGGACALHYLLDNHILHQAVVIITNIVMFFLPMFFIPCSYAAIFVVLRVRNRRLHPNSSGQSSDPKFRGLSKVEMNLIVTSAITTLLFIITWLPNQLYSTFYSFGYDMDYNDVPYFLTLLAIQINSCIIPFIYVLKIKGLRVAVLRSLRCTTSVLNLSAVTPNAN